MMKKLLLIFLLPVLLFAQSLDASGFEEKISRFENYSKRPRIGLALAGGAALGFAHLGVLEIIDSLDIPVDFIAGTSMGGIVGGLYSVGYSVPELVNITLSTNWTDIFTDKPSRRLMPYFEKKNTGRYQVEFALDGLTPVLPSGLIMGQKVSLIFSSLTYGFDNLETFDDLPTPFRCVAVDLITGKEVILDKGSLSIALRSTMSIPTVFAPIEYEDKLLIDGGVLNNFPVDVVRDMGADIVIGLNLVYPEKTKEDYSNLFDVMDRTTEIPRNSRLLENINASDLYIEEQTEGLSLMDFDPEIIPEIIHRGKTAAYNNIEALKKLKVFLEKWPSRKRSSELSGKEIAVINIKSDKSLNEIKIRNDLRIQETEFYEKEKLDNTINDLILLKEYKSIDYTPYLLPSGKVILDVSVEPFAFPVIEAVYINGNKTLDFSFIYSNLNIQPGDRFNTEIIENKINSLYGLGYFKTVTYKATAKESGGIALTVDIEENPMRKAQLGFRYNDFHQLVGAVSIETTSFLLSGLRTETELQFAGLSKISSKIYYPSRSIDISIYPFISGYYKNIPISIYDEAGKKFAQYKDRAWAVTVGAGIPVKKDWIFEMGFSLEWMNISADIASEVDNVVFPTWRDNLHLVQFSLLLDRLDDALVPTKGVLVNAETEISSTRLGSDIGYSRASVSAKYYTTVGEVHTFMFGGDYMLQWRDTPQYRWFNIGGPDSFVGYDYYQTYGSRFLIARFEYAYAYKKDIFLKLIGNVGFDYNLGPPSQAIVGDPLSGLGVALMFDSIIGPVQFTAASGDKSSFHPGEHRMIYYFSAGYKF